MEDAIAQVEKPLIASASDWEESYRPLPYVFFGLFITWTALVLVWTINTWSKRRWQSSSLQWMLTAVPLLKSLVLGLSFTFWYSCLNFSTCSFWMAFGVFVSRIFFETACFVAFLLIAHGYCTMHEQLSVSERRSIAGLASLLYLTLTGYKAAVSQFAVFVVLIYGLLLYVIMVHVARNLSVLREQLQQIQDGGVHILHTAIYTKYTMFKKFQRAMLMMVVAEILMHARADGMANEYWMRLLVREFAEIAIFFYVGWTFRSRELTPFFTVIPNLHSTGQRILPPIYSVEIDEEQFNTLDQKEWHIGVPTSISKNGNSQRTMLVIVQNPGMSDFSVSDDFAKEPKKPDVTVINRSSSFQQQRSPSFSRLRNSGDLSTSAESGSRRDNRLQITARDGKEDKNNANMVFMNSDVVVDMKGLKGYSFLQFDNPCGEPRTLLHSRNNPSFV